MTHIDPDLRRRMEEASVLPPDHPCRLAVCEAVCEAGEDAERLWMQLLCEDEQMRLALRRVETPAGLHERCRAICDAAADRPGVIGRLFRSTPVRGGLGMAAGMLLALAVWVTFQSMNPAGDAEAQAHAATQHLMQLTARTHHRAPDLQIRSGDRTAVEQALHDSPLPYPVSLPNLGAAYELIGGSAMMLDGKPVIYTRWRRGGEEYSLYQYCPIQFQMDRTMPFHHFKDAKVAGEERSLRVMTWSASHCAYAMVGADLTRAYSRDATPRPAGSV